MTKDTKVLITVESEAGIDTLNHATSGGRSPELLQDIASDQCENLTQDPGVLGCKLVGDTSTEATDNMNIEYKEQNEVAISTYEGVLGHTACC